jgi:hypothetical protein
MIPNEFIAAQQVKYRETGFNDCLTYSVNQTLRCRFFVTREQVQKLWKDTMKVNDEYVNSRKTNHGVSISAFKEFFVKDNQVFSIKEVERFKGENAFELLKQFVFDNLIKITTKMSSSS